MNDKDMSRALLKRIKSITDSRIKDGRTPSHVLDRAPKADNDWMKVSDYAGLLLGEEGE